VEQLLPRFRSAHTQVLGVSVDSIFCHSNWAASMGGISFPLLADFHPKGKMATDYGLYLSDNGITDRATVVIDASGVVRHASSVTPAGQRNIEELAGAKRSTGSMAVAWRPSRSRRGSSPARPCLSRTSAAPRAPSSWRDRISISTIG
jgi:alkyl hydroperoxide reductase subunit AhpC